MGVSWHSVSLRKFMQLQLCKLKYGYAAAALYCNLTLNVFGVRSWNFEAKVKNILVCSHSLSLDCILQIVHLYWATFPHHVKRNIILKYIGSLYLCVCVWKYLKIILSDFIEYAKSKMLTLYWPEL
jgi:hypothetical protein